jgi:hypothetical protein
MAIVRTDVSEEPSAFLQEPHGVTSKKTPFFIVTAVKTSNLTEDLLFHNYAGHAIEKWLRYYATNGKVVGSRLGEVNYFTNLPDPSSRTRPLDLLGRYLK